MDWLACLLVGRLVGRLVNWSWMSVVSESVTAWRSSWVHECVVYEYMGWTNVQWVKVRVGWPCGWPIDCVWLTWYWITRAIRGQPVINRLTNRWVQPCLRLQVCFNKLEKYFADLRRTLVGNLRCVCFRFKMTTIWCRQSKESTPWCCAENAIFQPWRKNHNNSAYIAILQNIYGKQPHQ
jgi:hypothetical protein